MRASSSPWVAIAALLAAMASIQFGASVAKGLFSVLDILEVTSVRLSLAAVIMMVLLRGWRARISSTNWQWLFVYGASLAGMNIMFYLAIHILPLGIAAAVQFLGPLSVAVFGSRKPVDFLWSAMAAAGLFLITKVDGSAGNVGLLGLAWALGAAACWALYIVSGQRAGAEHGAQTAALGMVIAAFVSLPFGLPEVATSHYTSHLLALLAAVAILSGVIPFTLEMVALRSLPARTFGTLMSLEPVMAALIGMARLGERLVTVQWIAIVLIVAASAGATLSARAKSKISDGA